MLLLLAALFASRVLGVKTDGDPDFRGLAASRERDLVSLESRLINVVLQPPHFAHYSRIGRVLLRPRRPENRDLHRFHP